jgi:methionine-rich copper-binding protein CopC
MQINAKAVAGLIAAGLLAALPAAPAWAHAHMTKSSPANGSTVTSTPAAIQAWFSEELATSGNRLQLYDARNKMLATGGLDAKVTGHTVLKLAPPHLSAGGYLVRWHVVSADDNAVSEGYFRFSVGSMAMAPSGGMAMAPSGTPASSLPALKLVGPADHSTVKNPVAVVIETPGDIKTLTMDGMGGMGGMAGPKVHLHIMVDGVANMPSSDQLTPAGQHRYQYVLAPLSRGTHTVKVFWADNKTHDAVGPTHAATFTVTQ